ncbi:MAG: class I SAM-dependent RNA methyltransferase, partial [Clostridia bacterium]|nr:class I SAM-dependent RNA methyltransferase [Clostridia bacterium]
MFLRTAGRVRVLLGEFDAEDFDTLFESVRSINWQDILPKDAKIIVTAKSVKSALFALSSIQSISKKAIVTSLCSHYGISKLPEDGAEYSVEISINVNHVRVTLDTSGAGLHKRGYRTWLGEAPIRGTLASAIIQLSVWNPDRPLIDPFCGSGTIPIEASLIGLNIAPGMNRSFACEDFTNAPKVRDIVQNEAEQLVNRDREIRISGFDINPEAIKLALRHADKAGVRDKIHLLVADMRNLSSRFSHGVIVTNPPYGERLLKEAELKDLYRDFGKVYGELDEWCAYVITSYLPFEKYFGRRATKTRKLYNSELECNLFQYLAKPPKMRFDSLYKKPTILK